MTKEKIKSLLPGFIKPFIRFIWYKNERRKVLINIVVGFKQNRLIKKHYESSCRSLIVFIVEGADWFTGRDNISGGILSIASIYEETEKLESIHGCKTIMVTPDYAYRMLKHTQFLSNIHVFRLKQVFHYFNGFDKMIIHIPELIVEMMGKQFEKYTKELQNINDLQINILNQSIHLMPEPNEIAKQKKFTQNITQTTAHDQYTTIENRNKYKIPLHKLSVFGSPEKYNRLTFDKKDNLIIVSPDEHPEKISILNYISSCLPNYKIVIIKNMPYKTYLEHASRAKYSITFGEGLDFYFIETVFSGGIGIAVYNEYFFTEQFWKLPGVFDDYDHLQKSITDFITSTNETEIYSNLNKQQYKIVSNVYKYNEYIENIKKFYLKEYTYK